MMSTAILPLEAAPPEPPADEPAVSAHAPPLPQSPSTRLPAPTCPNYASQITPQLYLCDAHTAFTAKVLTSLGITHVVSVMGPKLRFLPAIQVFHVPIEDMPWEDLLSHLSKTTEWIQRASVKEDARVLVHCWRGISRSASVVAAYFIKTQDMSANAAVAFVKSKRSIVRPNHGFMQQLRQYEAIVRADDESDYSMK